MTARSTLLALALVLGSSGAYAQSEGNNLAAVEIPTGTGIYFTTAPQPTVAAVTGTSVGEVAEMPGPRVRR